jgi:hypothetical protein
MKNNEIASRKNNNKRYTKIITNTTRHYLYDDPKIKETTRKTITVSLDNDGRRGRPDINKSSIDECVAANPP